MKKVKIKKKVKSNEKYRAGGTEYTVKREQEDRKQKRDDTKHLAGSVHLI